MCILTLLAVVFSLQKIMQPLPSCVWAMKTISKVCVERRMSFKEEQEFRRERSCPKRGSGPKEDRSQKMRLTPYLSRIKYLFRTDCPPLIGAVLEKNWLLLAFFRKMVSFNCTIEDLSALHAPLIDSVNWKRVASNNKCFFLSGRPSVILRSHKPKMTTGRAHSPMIHGCLCRRKKCDQPHQNKMISEMNILLQQTASENSSVARALVHVATFLREWIAVLSSRTERESDKRRILAYALSRLLSLCCRFGTADALLLLLLLMLLRLEWSYSSALLYEYLVVFLSTTPTTAAVTVQTVVRFFLRWMLGSWTSGPLSVPGMCQAPHAYMRKEDDVRHVIHTLCCCRSLLLVAAVVAGEQHQQKQQLASNNYIKAFFVCFV